MKEKNKLISWKQISKRIKQKKKEMESDKRYKKKVIKVPYQFFFFWEFWRASVTFSTFPFPLALFRLSRANERYFSTPLGQKS